MSRTLEITTANGHLGAVAMATSNIERFCADFSSFLDQGVILTEIVAAIDIINNDAVVNRLELSHDCKSAIWYMESPDVASVYNLTFTVTTSDEQILNYTLQYNVGAS